MIQKIFNFFLILLCLTVKADQPLTKKSDCTLKAQDLKVCGYAFLECLNVNGNEAIGGMLTIAGNESIGGDVAVAGNEIVGGNLIVTGTIIATDVFVSGIDLTGAVTDAANTCTTAGAIFIGKTGSTLNFRCLGAGAGISLTSDSNTISINATSTVVVTPVITSTIGGILAYASACNFDALQTVTSTGLVTFNTPGATSTVLPPTVNGSAFTIPAGHPGTYYFEYHVRGTPTAPIESDALFPPAPLVFQLLSNSVAIPFSQFASDTQTNPLPDQASGGTLAINGFLITTLAGAGAKVITLQNITGFDVVLEPTAQVGPTAGASAVNASLFVEQIA